MDRLTNSVPRIEGEDYKHSYGLASYVANGVITAGDQCFYRIYKYRTTPTAWVETTDTDNLKFVVHIADETAMRGLHVLDMKITNPSQTLAPDIERVHINFERE